MRIWSPLSVAVVVCLAATSLPSSEDGHVGRVTSGQGRSGLPIWIWATTQREREQSVVMRNSLVLPQRATRASLRVWADFNTCQVLLNGDAVLHLDDYGPLVEIDVTDAVIAGRNTIELRCVSSAGPAAVAASLDVRLVSGQQLSLQTNTDWQAHLLEKSAALTDEPESWYPATSFGEVARKLWPLEADAQITPFDDYTQWMQAIDASEGTNPATFRILPGFEIQLVRSAEPDEDSWVSMAIDPQGRITIAREGRGLLRMHLSSDGHRVEHVEVINDTLLECRGLLYAYDSLYANANTSRGFYRLRDTTGDDQFDDVQLLRRFPGSLGHGRNDLALGPDGLIYSIHGDAVDLPTTDVLDHTSPFREARKGSRSREGHLLRTDRDGSRWELVASGLRNPFGIDFNSENELFTYDADAEFDMGSSWYRPTRIVQIVPGGDYGWRGRTGDWPPYLLDHADNALPVCVVGKGSPTAVKSGERSHFPAPYRHAVFALDWAYGRIIACHLEPRGAGYAGRIETFLKGRPLNVTDLDFGPDGAMYIVTGGRQTQSALYRIQYPEHTSDPPKKSRQQIARREFGNERRTLRRQLALLPKDFEPVSLDVAWPHLASPDPVIRQVARVAVEHHPVGEWMDRALARAAKDRVPAALVALARSGEVEARPKILRRLNRLAWDEMSTYDKLTCLESYRLCLADLTSFDSSLLEETRDRITDLFPQGHRALEVPPVGSGSSLNRELSRLAFHLGANKVSETITLLSEAETQEDRIHYLFILRNVREGWTPADRRVYFEVLSEIERTVLGGEGMPGFLVRIRDEALATLSDAERSALKELLKPGSATAPLSLTIRRPAIRQWRGEDIEQVLAKTGTPRDLDRGAKLYGEVLCIHCHRLGRHGGTVGPDLSSVSSRFSRRDLLASILEPSRVVAEKYRNQTIVTTGGQVISGRVVTGGDYRSPTLRVAVDPLRPFQFTEIPKSEVEQYAHSEVSPMPTGLLDSLTADEILDLIAYIESSAR